MLLISGSFYPKTGIAAVWSGNYRVLAKIGKPFKLFAPVGHPNAFTSEEKTVDVDQVVVY